MFAGIDIGSMTAKCVILNESLIISCAVIPTDSNPKLAGTTVLKKALDAIGCNRKNIRRIVGTGYGRISLDFFDQTITELSCQAKGVRYSNTAIEGIIDIGGQDSKAIKLSPDGTISDFAMNDRCAAGTGRFLDAMAKALKIDQESFGKYYQASKKPCSINSTCVVFAESEVISLLAFGETKKDIAAGLHESIARRVGTLAKRTGLKSNIAFVGGVAKNIGLRTALEKYLGIKFTAISQDPQTTCALGASIIAKEGYRGRNKVKNKNEPSLKEYQVVNKTGSELQLSDTR
ncbi:MAG: 2-hydroxyglutaryl-CoA dehydratase [Desulfobacterium sp.]|nr:2-hydroxyglutaryl-CoA dehydratase [Desulfobacterium sp.]MBU3949048.1 2-hydroxyglutaryl-CoA dehydratase [Pseudomonadota bacterium]MBU4035943.1 2-hydroxyglutaryl-CoA dehydratase [Pseudomonadota bacterium]